jgi:hypothetical protein
MFLFSYGTSDPFCAVVVSLLSGFLFLRDQKFIPHPTPNIDDQSRSIFLVEKGPAADATDAPQVYAFLCNLIMKMKIMTIFVLFQVVEHRWNETDREKPTYSVNKLSQCHFVPCKSHMD